MGFIDTMRSQGHAVESICRVLREQGCQIAARTYRDWARADRPVAARTISDAMVTNQVRDLAWKIGHEGVRRMTPEGLYGRREDDRARTTNSAGCFARKRGPGEEIPGPARDPAVQGD